MISREEVKDLANLARFELSDAEVERFRRDMSSILDYVNSIDEVGDLTGREKMSVVNVMREDAVTNAPESYTEELLRAAPEREGRFVKVNKILSQDDA
jgi:aspartyl/glutamyl-tRNA(Asn/Gln) amidotransferase C subunit